MDTNTVCEFLKQSIEELIKVVPPEKHKWKNTSIIRYENSSRMEPSTKPDFKMEFFLSRALLKAAHVENFNKLLWEYEHIKNWMLNAQTQGYKGMVLPQTISYQLVEDYLSQLMQLDYDAELALEIASNFLNSLEKEYSKVIYYTVVRGLETDFETYNFVGGFRLHKLTDSEKAGFIDLDKSLLEDEDLFMNDCPCMLEYSCDLSVTKDPNFEEMTDHFNKIITALRLTKVGHVEYQDIRIRTENIGEILQQRHKYGNWRVRLRAFGITTYNLLTVDLQELENIIVGLEKLDHNQPSIQTALNRMNLASERQRPEDQIVDLMIAAEALFGGSGTGEVLFKLSMRCAKFLGSSLEERKKINKDIKAAYERRSAIVHGGAIKPTDIPTNEILHELSQYVRKSIILMLKEITSNSKVKFNDSYFNDLLLSIS